MNSSKELKKLVKLVAQARNAVKNAGNQIAEAHAQVLVCYLRWSV